MALLFDDNFSSFVQSTDGSAGWETQGSNGQRSIPESGGDYYFGDATDGSFNPYSDTQGVLGITAAAVKGPQGEDYTSGFMMSQGALNFEYGTISVTAELAAGQGIWPQFFLLPSNNTWPPEIDIMEMLGNNPNVIYATTHEGTSAANQTYQSMAVDLGVNTATSFNTYSVDWEPNTITWYFDGKEIAQEATPSDLNQPMYLAIDNGVGAAGSWSGAPSSSSEFPATMQVSSVQFTSSANTINVSGTDVATPIASLTGVAVDDYIANATVFADANGTGVYASGDAETTTNGEGQFTLTNALGPLILTGGVDVDTGLAFTGTLEAPSGSTVITPLTTLVEDIVGSDTDPTEVANGASAVAAAFGITLDPGQSLLTLDPEAGTTAGNGPAQSVLFAGAEVIDTIDILSAGLKAIAGTTPAENFAAISNAIAKEIEDNPGTQIDLSDTATLDDILNNAASALGVTGSLSPSADLSLETLAANLNSGLYSHVGGAVGTAAEELIAQVEYVAQGEVEPDLLMTGASIPTLESEFSGNSLTQDFAEAPACFCRGTRIATPSGEVPVEVLKVGDLVLTGDGQSAPILWIGRQTIATAFSDPLLTSPIRIRAGALADDAPARDLLVSPGHGLLVGDVLVHAGALVNGMSIVQETVEAPTFVYYHVELASHALILAENALVETFIDGVERMSFDNWAERAAPYPERHSPAEMPYPRAQSQRQTPCGVRAMLTDRAQRFALISEAA